MKLRVLVAAAIAFAGCHHAPPSLVAAGAASGVDAEAVAPDAFLAADAGPDVGGGDAASPADGGVADAGVPDALDGGPDPVAVYQQFVRDRNDRFYERWVTCFGASAQLLAADRVVDFTPTATASFRMGLVALDPEAARRCLETLMTASCERIADIQAHENFSGRNPVLPECVGVLAGQLAPGQACLHTGECRSPLENYCGGGFGCGRVCTPRPLREVGAACSDLTDRCPGGTVCRYAPDHRLDERCLPPTQDGGACDGGYQCAAGLMCAERTATSISDGTCRPLKIGTPCDGGWQCIYPYVCEGAGPGKPGTCQVGKPVGAACRINLQDVNGNVYSDCAVRSQCLDLDGRGQRCVAGSPLGGACGQLHPGRDNSFLACLEGYCDADPTVTPMGTCRATKPHDAECSSDDECTPPDGCFAVGATKRCRAGEVAPVAGKPCSLLLAHGCGEGNYCALPPDFDPDAGVRVPTAGSCAPLRHAGESCGHQSNSCEPLSQCVNNVCVKC
jgi:hypothetical protein